MLIRTWKLELKGIIIISHTEGYIAKRRFFPTSFKHIYNFQSTPSERQKIYQESKISHGRVLSVSFVFFLNVFQIIIFHVLLIFYFSFLNNLTQT